MLEEFIDRTIAEMRKLTLWPHLDDVEKLMRKVAIEIEADALANPIVPPQPAFVEASGGVGSSDPVLTHDEISALLNPEPEPTLEHADGPVDSTA